MARNPTPDRIRICLALLVLPCTALAAESRFALTAGAGSSNNIERTVSDTQSETIASVGTEFFVQKQTRRLYANLDGDLSWLDYLKGDYSSELVGSANTALRASLFEDVISWMVTDRFGQTRTDLLSALTPSNRENVNQFSTGPDFNLRLGGGLRLQVSGRYTRISYQDSPFDSQRFSQSIGLQREMSSGATLTLQAGTQQIDPQAAAIYQLDEASGVYEINGARTEMRLEAGATRMRSRDMEDDSSAMLRIQFARQFGARSRFTAGVRREIVDAGGSLGGWQGEGLPAGAFSLDLSQTSEPYLVESVQAAWTIQGRVTTLELGGEWQDQSYSSDSALDRRARDLRLRVTREVGPRLQVGVDFAYRDNDVQGSGDTRENMARLNADWRLGQRLSVGASGEFGWFERSGEPGTARENRYWANIRYGIQRQ